MLPLIIAGCSNKIEYVYVEPGLFSFTIHTDIDCKDIDINPNRVRAEDIKSIYAEEVEAKMVIKCCRYCHNILPQIININISFMAII